MNKAPVGISSCLLGQPVRYDGGHKCNRLITSRLQAIFEFRPFCPEVAIGLGVPREPFQLVRTSGGMRVRGVSDAELDVTDKLEQYGRQIVTGHPEICGYIFKARSPSCGTDSVATWTEQGKEDESNGTGAYAAALMQAIPGLPVIDEERLQDDRERERFIEQVTSRHHKRRHKQPR